MDSGSDSDEQPRTFTATFDEEYSLDPRKQEARPKDIIAITSSDDDDGLFLQGGVRRYFLEDSGPTCFNCGLTGHVSKECPESLVFDAVFCRICRATCAAKSAISVPGVARNAALIAVNRVTCSRPRKKRPNENELCHRCRLPGHVQQECSLGWRQYRFSKPLRKDAFYDQVRTLSRFCYNCASRGHFGDECPYKRSINFGIFHSPMFEYLQKADLQLSAEHHGSAHRPAYSGSYQRQPK